MSYPGSFDHVPLGCSWISFLSSCVPGFKYADYFGQPGETRRVRRWDTYSLRLFPVIEGISWQWPATFHGHFMTLVLPVRYNAVGMHIYENIRVWSSLRTFGCGCNFFILIQICREVFLPQNFNCLSIILLFLVSFHMVLNHGAVFCR